MVHLLTGTYICSHPIRYAELLDCLERNLENPEIERVHAFQEDDGVCHPRRVKLLNHRHAKLLKHPKVMVVDVGRRMTYREYFQYANAMLPDHCCVMANSDVYFDTSLSKITPELLLKYFLACSRIHVRADGTVEFDPKASCAQDAWFFRPPVKVPTDSNFHFGLPGCDNRIAYLMETQSGLRVVNPSRTIALYHHHASKIASYGPRVPGPYLDVVPQELPKN